MTKNTQFLSRLMRVSWDIQKHRRTTTRSKALIAAWAIVQNEDVTVQYLTRKLNHGKEVKRTTTQQYGLFNS